ncbi:MAG: type 4a pilus biogenesis protein PilO [Oligoflexia bacterium]|nr:type 4a pilus biogenesis protein PilO [Oligoflexia bacterium]
MASLSDRIKVAPPSLFFLVGAGLAAALYFTYGSEAEKLRPQILSLKDQVAKAKAKLKETKDRAQNRETFQNEMESVSVTLRQALEYLPKELDVQDLLRKVYSEARTSGVELSVFKPKDPTPKDFYDELLMDIKLKGTYPQLVTFLGNVSKIPRIINIRNVIIGSPKFIDGYPMMEMSGTLVGYRYKEGKGK